MPSLASRAATIRSQASATSSPPATAKPSIAAMSGLRAARWTMPAKPRSPTHGRSPVTKALRSMPAQKPAPAPVMTPTARSPSASSSSSAAATPSASARLTALRASGRLSVMSSTPSRRSVRTGSSGMGGRYKSPDARRRHDRVRRAAARRGGRAGTARPAPGAGAHRGQRTVPFGPALLARLRDGRAADRPGPRGRRRRRGDRRRGRRPSGRGTASSARG